MEIEGYTLRFFFFSWLSTSGYVGEYVCMCTHLDVCYGPKGAGPEMHMMDCGGQLIVPLLTDTHTHTTPKDPTCLTPVPHGGLLAPEATALETNKAQNDSACQQKFEKGKNFVGHKVF